MKPDEVKQTIIKTLQASGGALNGYTVVLFGSRASQNPHSRSDFDVGVIGEKPLPLSIFYHIESQFDEIETLYTIDWVDLTQTTPSFRDEALKQIEVLYEG